MAAEGGGSRVTQWLDELKLAGGILAVVGVLAYGVLRLAYVQFYSHFDALPEDAGLGKTELLSQALVGPAVLLIVASGVTVLIVFALLLLNSLYWALGGVLVRHVLSFLASRRMTSEETTEFVAKVEKRLARVLRLPGSVGEAVVSVLNLFPIIVVAGTVVALVITVSSLFVFAHTAADDVLNSPHRTLQGRSLGVGRYSLPLLDVRALAASVDWVGSSAAPAVLSTDDACLMFLGQTDDTVLIYDASQALTIRLQRDNAVVAIRTDETQLPDTCS